MGTIAGAYVICSRLHLAFLYAMLSAPMNGRNADVNVVRNRVHFVILDLNGHNAVVTMVLHCCAQRFSCLPVCES